MPMKSYPWFLWWQVSTLRMSGFWEECPQFLRSRLPDWEKHLYVTIWNFSEILIKGLTATSLIESWPLTLRSYFIGCILNLTFLLLRSFSFLTLFGQLKRLFWDLYISFTFCLKTNFPLQLNFLTLSYIIRQRQIIIFFQEIFLASSTMSLVTFAIFHVTFGDIVTKILLFFQYQRGICSLFFQPLLRVSMQPFQSPPTTSFKENITFWLLLW